MIIATRINKLFECDTFMTKNLENHTESTDFQAIHISETYSTGDITFDFCFYGNTKLLTENP